MDSYINSSLLITTQTVVTEPPKVFTIKLLSERNKAIIQHIINVAQYKIQKTISGNPHADFVPDRLNDDYGNITYSHPHKTAGFNQFDFYSAPYGYIPLTRISDFIKNDPEQWTIKKLDYFSKFADPKATLVVQGLYLGSVYHTHELPYLEYLGVKFIVSAIETKDFPAKLREIATVTNVETMSTAETMATAKLPIIVRHLDIKDDGSKEHKEKLGSVLNAIVDELHTQIENGTTCFVHCQFGISRSSTIVAAYLIKYKQYTASNAVEYLRSHRPQVNPKRNFMVLLKEYERSLSS